MTLRSQLGIEAYDYRKTSKTLSSHPNADGIGTTTELFQRNSQFTITNTAEYKFDINYDHHVTLLAGQEGIKAILTALSARQQDKMTTVCLEYGVEPAHF